MNWIKPQLCLRIFQTTIKNGYASSVLQNVMKTQLKHSPRAQLANSVNYGASASATTVDQENGILKRILKKAGFGSSSKNRLRVSSIMLYECAADNINYFEFFNEFNLPDTFNSWFLVTELHIWMILVRVMNEGADSGQDGRFLRNFIVEAMWADSSQRAKKLFAENPSMIRENLAVLSEQFQATLITYDEGLMMDDKVLASALWRRFFSKECDDYSKLEKLVKYIREQILILDHMPRKELLSKPVIKWASLSSV